MIKLKFERLGKAPKNPLRTLELLPKRFIDATKDPDPYLAQKKKLRETRCIDAAPLTLFTED